jgi:hypothetical protein
MYDIWQLAVLKYSAGEVSPGTAEPDRAQINADARLGEDPRVVDDVPALVV